MKTSTSRTIRVLNRAREIWSELDHAQRRLLEIQSGLSAWPRGDRRVGERGRF